MFLFDYLTWDSIVKKEKHTNQLLYSNVQTSWDGLMNNNDMKRVSMREERVLMREFGRKLLFIEKHTPNIQTT